MIAVSPMPILSHDSPITAAYEAVRSALLANLSARQPVTRKDVESIDALLAEQRADATGRLTALRPVAPAARTYLVQFDRIGREHEPPPLVTLRVDLAHLADDILRHARHFLGSSDVEVFLDDASRTGRIVVGQVRTAGTFTYAETTGVAP